MNGSTLWRPGLPKINRVRPECAHPNYSRLHKPSPKLHFSTVCPIPPLGSTGPEFFSVFFFFWPSSSTLNADDAILFRTHCDIQLISGLINSRIFPVFFSYPALLMYQSAQTTAATEVFVFTISLQICNLFFEMQN